MSTRKDEIAIVRASLAQAHKDVEEKFNITIQIGTITYENNYFTCKITATNNTKEGKKVSKEAMDFKRLAANYGLVRTDLHRTISIAGIEYIITGLKPRNTKYPIIGICLTTGVKHKFPVYLVKKYLNISSSNSSNSNSNILRPGKWH